MEYFVYFTLRHNVHHLMYYQVQIRNMNEMQWYQINTFGHRQYNEKHWKCRWPLELTKLTRIRQDRLRLTAGSTNSVIVSHGTRTTAANRCQTEPSLLKYTPEDYGDFPVHIYISVNTKRVTTWMVTMKYINIQCYIQGNINKRGQL